MASNNLQQASENNNQLAANYIAKMQAEVSEAEAPIAQLKALFPKVTQLEALLALAKECPGLFDVQKIQNALDALNAQVTQLTNQLNAIDPDLASLDSAIATLENGVYTLASDGDANMGEDIQMFSNYLNAICNAMVDKLQSDLWKNKMQADGDNNQDLMEDAVHAMQASSAENGILLGMQQEMANDFVTLNDQKNAAQTDLDSYRWYDDVLSFGTDEAAKDKDRAIIRNSEDMMKILSTLMSEIAPEIASTQNDIYATASLSMQKILDKLMQLISDTSLSAQQKADGIKCLMALALGILAIIQTDAAQEKAKNQQTEVSSANAATKMNISNQRAELQQLQNDLAYASAMGGLMKIAKAVMEVAGTLLAPGIGSFLVMAALMVADQAGLVDKLTNALSKAGLGNIGAQVFVGALEVAATLGGGAAIDNIVESATAEVMVVAAQETSAIVAKVVEEAVQKAATTTGRSLTQAEQKEVEKVVTEAVTKAVESAVRKTVIQFNNQAASSLLPQLLKAGVKEGTANISTMLAEAAETNAIIAAKAAAETAAKDVSFLAEAAAKGAQVTSEDITAIANRAANEAVANLTDSTPENVAKATERSSLTKGLSRAGWTAVYNGLNDGLISNSVEAALKKAGLKDDDKGLQAAMDAIKAIEGILSSFAMMYGSGVLQSTIMNGSSTTLLKAAAMVQVAGTGAQAISSGGQAEADMKQANAVQAINESSVSNDMIQMFIEQFNKQGDIDRKTLENQMAEQASNYTMISQLENNSKEAAMVLSQQAV